MELKEVVKEKYGQAALRVNVGGSSCCGASAALDRCCDPITSNLYDAAQTGVLPQLSGNTMGRALPAWQLARASLLLIPTRHPPAQAMPPIGDFRRFITLRSGV